MHPLDRLDDATLSFVDKHLNVVEGAGKLNDWGLDAEKRLKDNFGTDAHPTQKAKVMALQGANKLNDWGLEQDVAVKKRLINGVIATLEGAERLRAFMANARIGEHAVELAGRTNDWVLEQDKKIAKKAREMHKRRPVTAAVALGVVAVAMLASVSGGESSQADVKSPTSHTQIIPGGLAKFDLNSNLLPKTMTKANTKKAAPTAAKVEALTAKVPKPAAEAKPAAESKITKSKVKAEAHPLTVKTGDHLWDVLEGAGIPSTEIMQRLDAAAKKSGLNYEWHGSGKSRWLEVNGKSDAKSIVVSLDKFIKR
jgi:hypothetical protein